MEDGMLKRDAVDYGRHEKSVLRTFVRYPHLCRATPVGSGRGLRVASHGRGRIARR